MCLNRWEKMSYPLTEKLNFKPISYGTKLIYSFNIQKARYDLNITELKTLAYIFSKIKPTDDKLEEYTFSIKEY